MGIRKALRRLLSRAERQRARDVATANVFLSVSDGGRLLLSHDLPDGAVVLDVGGYLGDWTAAMARRYPARYLVFEPVPTFAERMRVRFSDLAGIEVHAYGLAAQDGHIDIALLGDATSAFRGAAQTVQVALRDYRQVLDQAGIVRVDLMAINAEGAEFDLLETMIATNDLIRFDRLMIQFHRVVDQADSRRAAIQAALAQSHEKVFDFPFCWELWRRRREILDVPETTR